ncbi:MAG: hypothetical protein Q7S32_02260 [bacterium]|nr:hypothetical protein [bacterium]
MRTHGKMIATVVVVVLIIVLLAWKFWPAGDEKYMNREIPISVMMRHPVLLNGKAAPGRLFEFVNRGGPLGPSVIIPLKNRAGVDLVRHDPAMTAGTIKLVDVDIPEMMVDLVRYPAGTIRVVYFNVHHIEPQVVDPVPAIPRMGTGN